MTTAVQKPYEWQRVIVLALTLFLLGLTTARSPFGSADRFALGLLSGTIWATVGGVIVAIWKYFKRSPTTITPAAIQANDKGLFIAALVLAVFLAGKAFYLETYGALVDATILIGLGFAVKAGIGPARWGFAIYAFISPILVMVNGGGNAVIWPFVFYYACRSLGSDVTTTGVGNDFPPTPQSESSVKLTPTPTSTPSTSLSQDSIYQPTARPPQPVMPTPSTSMPSIAPHAPAFDEDAVYEIVANEMESGKTDKGLWTRLFAELDGDEKKMKVAYIKQRAEKLIAAERSRLQEVARLEAENAERLASIQVAAVAESKRLESLTVRARVQEQLQNGETVLLPADKFLHAVRCGDIGSVSRFLSDNEMYVAVVDSGTRNSALHIAVAEKNSAMAKLLIQSGAPVSIKNGYGLSPVDFAKDSPNLLAVFKEEGAI